MAFIMGCLDYAVNEDTTLVDASEHLNCCSLYIVILEGNGYVAYMTHEVYSVHKRLIFPLSMDITLDESSLL